MKKCRFCKSEMKKGSKVCPNCNKKQGVGILNIVMIVIVIAIVLSIIGSCSNNSKSSTSTTTDNSITTNEPAQSTPATATTIEGALSATDRTKGSTISQGSGTNGVPELVIDSKISDFSEKSNAYAVCYDACEALKNIPDLQNYGDIMFNFNGDYVANDGTTQNMPVIRLRYTVNQINNFDFSSKDYVSYQNIADVVKMNVK